MLTFNHPVQLNAHINELKKEGKRIGFFPTMGALHDGHLSLLKACKASCDISVCSIFVNPTQFTNPEDLAKYPRTETADSILLESGGCDILFVPNQQVIYAEEKPMTINFGELTTRLEGASRPGHFEGVARIVKLLFDCVHPDDAFFGQKDFQQCLVIQALVAQLHPGIKLHFMPTQRESDGLAMSSRNRRLDAVQRRHAPSIYHTLLWAKDQFGHLPVHEIEQLAAEKIEKNTGFRVDYFKIANAATLEPLVHSENIDAAVALTAVYAGDIRLIDNLLLK